MKTMRNLFRNGHVLPWELTDLYHVLVSIALKVGNSEHTGSLKKLKADLLRDSQRTLKYPSTEVLCPALTISFILKRMYALRYIRLVQYVVLNV